MRNRFSCSRVPGIEIALSEKLFHKTYFHILKTHGNHSVIQGMFSKPFSGVFKFNNEFYDELYNFPHYAVDIYIFWK